MSRYEEVDLANVRTYSVTQRHSKVHHQAVARPHRRGDFFESFYKSLPDVLIGRDLRELVERIIGARARQKPVILMMGAHVVKVGLSPIVVDLMERGIVTGVASNGASIVHDTELALFGETSEEVAEGLADGSFGMAVETAEFINNAVKGARSEALGLGEAVGRAINQQSRANATLSILACGDRCNLPVTIHVGIGTDIIHQHSSMDGAAYGELSFRDFKILSREVMDLNDGGVLLNIGSSVLMPEVFLKALTIARNVHPPVNNFFTANFDMIMHYRPRVNVVQRPTLQGGKGYNFIGHHEIMLPLLAAAIKEFI